MENAYDRLCDAEKESISLETFKVSAGREYSVLAEGGVRGGDLEYPSDHELPGEVNAVWTELIVDQSFQGGPTRVWRLHQTLERDWWELNGDWKICGIEPANS